MKELFKQMQDLLPDFIDEHYPKGNKERGVATVAITLFLIWYNKKDETS